MGKSAKKIGGAAAGGLPGLALASGVGKKLFGVGDKFGQSTLNRKPFDISKEAAAKSAAISPLTQQQKNVQQGAEQAFGQANLAQTLLNRATGQGPSLSGANLKAAQERNLAQLLSQQSALRGRATAGSARNLARAQGEMGRQTAQDFASAALQERRQGEADLMAFRQAERDRYLDDLERQFATDTAAKREMQQAELGQFQADTQRNALIGQARNDRSAALMSGISSGLAAFAGSDKEMKKEIKSAEKSTEDFLNKLSAKSYKYKDTSKPGTFEGDNYGIMAQDLEKSEMGKSLVVDTEEGKMVDTKKGFGAVLASMSELNKRIAALEKRKKKA